MSALRAALALTAALALPAAGATIHVPADQPSVAIGLAFAGSGDTVLVAAGTYLESGLGLHGGVTLRGATGDPAAVILDAAGAGRVLYAEEMGPGTRVEAVTIAGGGISEAAGIRIGHAAVDLTDCIFRENVADSYGGAAYLPFPDSEASFTRCRFEGNQAGTGGGAVLAWATAGVAFLDCTFTNNVAGLYGGAVQCYQVDCSFTGCTFAANAAGLAGGGIYLEACLAELERCLVTGSTAGGALQVFASAGLTLHCCDLWGNTDGDWVAPFGGWLGTAGNIAADPLFCGVEGSGDYRLRSDSPCAPAASGCGGPIGAWPVGCDAAATARISWSGLKGLY